MLFYFLFLDANNGGGVHSSRVGDLRKKLSTLNQQWDDTVRVWAFMESHVNLLFITTETSDRQQSEDLPMDELSLETSQRQLAAGKWGVYSKCAQYYHHPHQESLHQGRGKNVSFLCAPFKLCGVWSSRPVEGAPASWQTIHWFTCHVNIRGVISWIPASVSWRSAMWHCLWAQI